VHDEIIIDADKNEISDVVSAVPRLMGNSVVEEFVRVETDCEISYTTWADKEAYSGD
jgi:DNA polymerase I-like protein with 3'-5' exonuclease and polymerase domains